MTSSGMEAGGKTLALDVHLHYEYEKNMSKVKRNNEIINVFMNVQKKLTFKSGNQQKKTFWKELRHLRNASTVQVDKDKL
jgi:hypothetical protein